MMFPLIQIAMLATLVVARLLKMKVQRQTVLLAAESAPLPYLVLIVLGGVVIAAITEEIIYRGMLYATLRRYLGPLTSIVVSAAIFAALHQMAYGFLVLFVIGFLLAYLYERTGSLVASIVAHAAHNLLTFTIVLSAGTG
jgi:membrane protease YdiL (CAAX protease family)